MHTASAPATRRDRLAALLRGNRLVVVAELVIIVLIRFEILVPFTPATIPLLLLGSLSLWLRQSGWREIGMGRPASWRRTILLGVGIAVVGSILDWTVIIPLLRRLPGEPLDLSEFASLPGNLSQLLLWVGLSWTLAAFGEEMVWRGYILNRLADLLGRSRAGWALSLFAMGLLFGVGHIYLGPAGLILNIVDGIVLGVLYLASGRNLWLPVIEHGVGNTLSFILLFLGFRV